MREAVQSSPSGVVNRVAAGEGRGLDVDHFVIECEASDAGGGQCWQMLRRSFSSPRLCVLLDSVLSSRGPVDHFPPLLSAYLSSRLPIERIIKLRRSPTKINLMYGDLAPSRKLRALQPALTESSAKKKGKKERRERRRGGPARKRYVYAWNAPRQ